MNGFTRLILSEGDIAEVVSKVLGTTRLLMNAGDIRSVIENAGRLASICATNGFHGVAAKLLAAAALQREQIGARPTAHKVTEVLDADAVSRARAGYRGAGSICHCTGEGIVAKQRVREDDDGTADAHDPDIRYSLTPWETEALRLLTQGHFAVGMFESLYVRPRTTATHITNMLARLEVSNRTAAVTLAIRTGFV